MRFIQRSAPACLCDGDSASVPLRPGKAALSLMLNGRGEIVCYGTYDCIGASHGVALYQPWRQVPQQTYRSTLVADPVYDPDNENLLG